MLTLEDLKKTKKVLSCACLITDGEKVLVELATGRKYQENCLDLPKGLHEDGESLSETAKREVFEETGIKVNNLKELGIFKYNSSKNVALTLYYTNELPSLSTMKCDSFFERDGKKLPEIKGYYYVKPEELKNLLYKSYNTVFKSFESVYKMSLADYIRKLKKNDEI